MTAKYDYVVVGAGLTGATIARVLSDAGYRVIVVERRNHIGGNVWDELHESGARVHRYGPHYFRTSSRKVWSFVTRFAKFYPFAAKVVCELDGQRIPWPLQASYLQQLCGDVRPAFTGVPRNFEEAALTKLPRLAYDLFVRDYTEKQWGVAPSRLLPSLAKRLEVRTNGDPHLTPKARYQGLPVGGYARLVARMLTEITTILNCDYFAVADHLRPRKKLIYTGPIDRFFDYQFGRLPYRCQRREVRYYADLTDYQGTEQVNYPLHRQGPLVRSIEWKWLNPRKAVRGSVVTIETPANATGLDDLEYPIPLPEAQEVYAKYRHLADQYSSLVVCGRTGEYRYLDMDVAILRALTVARQLAVENKLPAT